MTEQLEPPCECQSPGFCQRYQIEQQEYPWQRCQGKHGEVLAQRSRRKWRLKLIQISGTGPSLIQKVVNAGRAVVEAVKGKIRGVPVLCPPEIAESREVICKSNTCGLYDSENDRCKHPKCGCPAGRRLRGNGKRPGKVEVSTQRCPLGLWLPWQPT